LEDEEARFSSSIARIVRFVTSWRLLMERIEKVIEINAPINVVFGLYSNFEKFPEWMKSLKEVRRVDESHTKWTANAPLMNVEWEAETTAFEPERRIAWKTVRGDVEMDGDVTFEETEGSTTRMHISLGYEPPAGRLGSLVAHLLGSDPEQQIDEELKRFARMAERQAALPSSTKQKKGAAGGGRRAARKRAA
jgi:uncharacterized membrane protein